MTAAELIAALSKAPPDTPVVIWVGWDNEFRNVTEFDAVMTIFKGASPVVQGRVSPPRSGVGCALGFDVLPDDFQRGPSAGCGEVRRRP